MKYNKKKAEKSNYALSENSKKANKDFDTANRIASGLYAIFKQLLPYRNRERYHKLCKAITKILHSGPKEQLGQHLLHQGNLGYLKGYRLHPYTLSSTILRCLNHIHISFDQYTLRIALPAILQKDVHAPERASQLLVRFTCCEIDDRTCDVQAHISTALSIPTRTNKEELGNPKKLNIPLPHAEGKVMLVVITLQMRFDGDTSFSEGFLTADRKYYAGEVLRVGYVKDGQWMTFEKPEQTWSTQGVYLDDQNSIEWEE